MPKVTLQLFSNCCKQHQERLADIDIDRLLNILLLFNYNAHTQTNKLYYDF